MQKTLESLEAALQPREEQPPPKEQR
jgi:hypothetical protein